MLSTPPAFILSQNQTLELIGIKPILKDLRTEALSRLFFSHYLCWLCFVVLMYFKVIDRNFLSNLNLKEFISFYSIFNLRFRTSVRCSFRGSSFILSHWFLFVKRFSEVFSDFFEVFFELHFYLRGLSLNFFPDELLFQASFHRISHLTFICQAIFRSFFRFFEVLSNLIFIWKVWTLTSFLISRSFERAFIRYHIWHSFVNWFSEVFSEIFRSFCRKFLRLPMRTKWPQTPLFTELSEDVFPATAQLRYHL